MFRLLENAFVSQKKEFTHESTHFYSWHQATLSQVLIITREQKEITHFLQAAFFENISPSRKGGRRNYERAEKMTKLNLWVYWLQVLMNPTIFASFLFLVSILMRHNLSRLKFFNLTNNFFSENCSVQASLHKR